MSFDTLFTLIILVLLAVVFPLLGVRDYRPPTENRWFDMASITAGVCEEILYRGLLLATLVSLVGTWPAVAISSLIFGLGHAYQGVSGIVKTGLVGLILALLTVFSGSLFIAIVLHAVVDLTSGRIMGRALRMTPPQTGLDKHLGA